MKQWFTPAIGHNSLSKVTITEHLGQRVINREYGATFWATPPIDTPSLLDSMPGVGPVQFQKELENKMIHSVEHWLGIIGHQRH